MTPVFDNNKPYGLIFGHSRALYEQGGVLFDARENHVVDDDEENSEEEDQRDESGVAGFVTSMLAGGPVTQANMYREAQLRQLSWEEIKKAAAVLGVAIQQVKGKAVWSLTPHN